MPQASIFKKELSVSLMVRFLLGVTLAFGLIRAIHLGLNRVFVLDEFYYAHQSWLASWSGHGISELIFKGEHFMTALAYLPFTVMAANDPGHLNYLRVGSLAFLLLGVAFSSYVACKMNPTFKVSAVICPILLLSMGHFLKFGSQIRPDMIALALFLLTLVLLLNQSSHSRLPASLAAIALMAAVLVSAKAAVYGASLGLVFIYEILTRKKENDMLFKHPRCFFLTSLGGVFILVFFLSMAGQLDAFWQGKVQTTLDHQKHYPKIDPASFIKIFLEQDFLVVRLSILGIFLYVYQNIKEFMASRKMPSGISLVLVFGYIGTWLSFFLQKAPYPYSLLPAIVFSAIFATYGLCFVIQVLPPNFSRHPRVVAPAVIIFSAIAVLDIYRKSDIDRYNDRQLEILSSIGQLTDVDDTVYDMSSSFVFRPHAHHLLIMDRFRINLYKDQVIKELPQVLKDRETALFIYDGRFDKNFKETELGDFIENHYVKYNNDIWVWGKKFPSEGSPFAQQSSRFHAIKHGKYFIHLVSGNSETIKIDGKIVKGSIVHLEKGEHQIQYGEASEFYLIWLPRDNTVFDPNKEFPPCSLAWFVL
jgi:hypothetical protein